MLTTTIAVASFIAVCISIGIGVLGYFFSIHMINPGQILSPYGQMLHKLSNTGKFGKYISNPLGLCHKCMPAMLCLIYWLTRQLPISFEDLLYIGIFCAIAGVTAVFLENKLK